MSGWIGRAELPWYEAHGVGRRKFKIKRFLEWVMKVTKTGYVICVRAEESDDIEVRKVYRGLADDSAAKRGYLRVVDESGKDYLYPRSASPQLSSAAKRFGHFTARPRRANTGMQPTAQKTRRG